MRFLTGTEAAIVAINEQEATDRGCSGDTTEWYIRALTASGDVCLLINDDKLIPGSTTVEPEWPSGD